MEEEKPARVSKCISCKDQIDAYSKRMEASRKRAAEAPEARRAMTLIEIEEYRALNNK